MCSRAAHPCVFCVVGKRRREKWFISSQWCLWAHTHTRKEAGELKRDPKRKMWSNTGWKSRCWKIKSTSLRCAAREKKIRRVKGERRRANISAIPKNLRTNEKIYKKDKTHTKNTHRRSRNDRFWPGKLPKSTAPHYANAVGWEKKNLVHGLFFFCGLDTVQLDVELYLSMSCYSVLALAYTGIFHYFAFSVAFFLSHYYFSLCLPFFSLSIFLSLSISQ